MSFRGHCFGGLAFIIINGAVSPPNFASVRSLMLKFLFYGMSIFAVNSINDTSDMKKFCVFLTFWMLMQFPTDICKTRCTMVCVCATLPKLFICFSMLCEEIL